MSGSKRTRAWTKQEIDLGLKGLKRVEIVKGPPLGTEVYPDAERLRWLFKEQKELALEKGLLKEDNEKKEPGN